MAETNTVTRESGTVSLGAKLPPILQTSPAMEAASKGMLDEQTRLNQALPALQAPVEARRADLQGELAKPLPAAPKLMDVPQFQPREVNGQELMLFSGVAMALAGLGTKAMRGDTAMALDAAGSAMKGFNTGNLQQARLDIQNFNEKMTAVIAENRKMSEEYRTIIENRRLSLAEKEQALRVAASSRDDQVMLSALQQKNFKTIFDLEAHRINAANQANLRLGQIMAQYDRMAMQKEIAAMRAKASEHGRQNGLTPEAIDNAAAFYILNGRMPVGMARIGQSAIEAIQNRAGEMTSKMGMTPEQFAAAGPIVKQKLGALLALEKQRNAIQSFEGMLDLNIDILKELSGKVDRTDSPYANKSILWLKQNAAGDPDVAEYLFQVNTASTEIARILNNPNMSGQLTDSARHELQGVLDGSLNPAQMNRVLSRAQSDARNRSTMLDKQVEKVVKEVQNPLGIQQPGAGGGGSAGPARSFASEAEAEAAGLAPGTRVIINGVPGTWQ